MTINSWFSMIFPLEMMIFPWKNVIFHSYVNDDQRVTMKNQRRVAQQFQLLNLRVLRQALLWGGALQVTPSADQDAATVLGGDHRRLQLVLWPLVLWRGSKQTVWSYSIPNKNPGNSEIPPVRKFESKMVRCFPNLDSIGSSDHPGELNDHQGY